MRALTVQPGQSSSVDVRDVPDPTPGEGDLLVEGLAVGVCGTDHEIARGDYGWAPEGRKRLVLGHESLGRVRSAPDGSGFTEGDLVAGVVRRPDPVPCGACAHGEWDMCRNGKYQERGIKELDGYASELWTVEQEYAVKLAPELGRHGVLVEPTSVVAKAWEQVDRIGGRAWFEPSRVLVTGAGPIGLLAALVGRQRGLEVHVLDRVTDGRKPELVEALGARYHHGTLEEATRGAAPDIVIEATGVGQLVFDAVAATSSYGIVCLTGVSSGGHQIRLDAGALNREVVLENDTVVGSVNANLRHYEAASRILAEADPDWLGRVLSREVHLADAAQLFAEDSADHDDVKVVIAIDDAG